MTKVEALNRAIEAIKTNKYGYSWMDFNSCNCGTIARELLNGELPMKNGILWIVNKVKVIPSGFHGAYEDSVNYCKSSGEPMPKVIKVLYDAGFTFEEMRELENCLSDKDKVISLMEKIRDKSISYPNISATIAAELKESPECSDLPLKSHKVLD